MKKSFLFGLVAALGLVACGQSPSKQKQSQNRTSAPLENSLLWKISGNGLSKPSYLFGTMHIVCDSRIGLSDSLRNAISKADEIFLEIDMSDQLGMMSALMNMKMQGDTTLADLLSAQDYKKVKEHFEKSGGMIPFNMLENFKPMLISSMLMEQGGGCENMVIMDQLVMEEAQKHDIKIDGLETVKFQISMFDSIPYKFQAEQLVKMIDNKGDTADRSQMDKLTNAYRNQELSKMDELIMQDDISMNHFTDLLLYNRNKNWARKLQELLPNKSLVVAVGAGHLPGEKGVINLLRKAGYKVEPVKNDMVKKTGKDI